MHIQLWGPVALWDQPDQELRKYQVSSQKILEVQIRVPTQVKLQSEIIFLAQFVALRDIAAVTKTIVLFTGEQTKNNYLF